MLGTMKVKYFPSEKDKAAKKWFSDGGDKNLRLNYDLNKDSIVFDVGGYVGDWTSDIYSKYLCRIHIFEPIPKFAELIKKRFEKNKDIKSYNFGLGGKTQKRKMSFDEYSSSSFKKGEQETLIKDISEFIESQKIKQIDLMKINIEGDEYDLLENLIISGKIKNIKNIQVQFHDFVPNAKNRMKKIQKDLRKTHKLTYQYYFIWENWNLKSKK